ncbi:MAG: SMP-30/gluconolactonase/LRE family protein [Desulfatibacillaceae bacterium]
MRRVALLVMALMLVAACGRTPYVRTVLFDEYGANGGMYVEGITGPENLVFDGYGTMFVTTMQGEVYRVVPTDDPWRGRIDGKRQLGERCFGIAVAPGDILFVAVEVAPRDRRIVRLDGALEQEPQVLSHNIGGLNGITLHDGYLYYTTSNEAMTAAAQGTIKRVVAMEPDFAAAETIVPGAGFVNGVALEPDGELLYYTETFNGVWSFNMETGEKTQIADAEFMGVMDGVTVADDETAWVCSNSQKAVIPVKHGGMRIGYHIDGMGAPSACAMGMGPGFDNNTLYITEIAQRSRCKWFDGRGVWALPLDKVRP